MNHDAHMRFDPISCGVIVLLMGIYFACDRAPIILILAAMTPAGYSIAKEMIREKSSFLEAVKESKIQIVISVLILIMVCISIK